MFLTANGAVHHLLDSSTLVSPAQSKGRGRYLRFISIPLRIGRSVYSLHYHRNLNNTTHAVDCSE